MIAIFNSAILKVNAQVSLSRFLKSGLGGGGGGCDNLWMRFWWWLLG